jgi:3-hydroxyisobutyrate dehydrogenase
VAGQSLATKAGLDGKAVMGVLDFADYSSLLIRNVGQRSPARDFSPNFYLRHMLKDARLIGDFARRLEVPVPVAATIGELYQAAVNEGLGDLNASGLHRMLFEMSGLTRSHRNEASLRPDAAAPSWSGNPESLTRRV